MSPNKKILIVSGEPSGDLHASNLVKDLKSLDSSLVFFGMGGALSRDAGVEIVFDITKLAITGVTDVFKHISIIKRARDAVIARCELDRPDLAIFVDYPGFNLKLAADMSKRGIPVAYYISPQIWAWGRQRVHLIKKYVGKMIVFFAFEKELYKSYGIDAEFVGHPLVDVVKVTTSKDAVLKKYSLSPVKKTVAILSGSREYEIKTFLPAIAKAAVAVSKKMPDVQFIISKHPGRPISMYENALKGTRFDYKLVEGDLHNIVAASDFAVVASGTATLEVGMIGTPLIVVCKTSLLTYILYNVVTDTHFIGLVNIIAGKEVAPELLQYGMTPKNIAAGIEAALSDPAKLAAMRRDLESIKSSLGPGGASMRAARAILPLLK